jgi:hypothetical protein
VRKGYLDAWQKEVGEAVERMIVERQSQRPDFIATDAERRRMEAQIIEQFQLEYSTIPQGGGREYEFVLKDVYQEWLALRERYAGLIDREVERRIKEENVTLPADEAQRKAARDEIAQRVFDEWQRAGRIPPIPELTLVFKLNAGSNDPAALYGVTFAARGYEIATRQVVLKSAQLLTIPIGLVDEDGVLRLTIFNAPENQWAISFPPDGLEILYSAGGYELNFLRVFLVMWVKLGFIAAVGVTAATFLSFPVACLVSLCVLFAAESASFLQSALQEYYSIRDQSGQVDYIRVVIRAIAIPIAALFELYSDLRPGARLVDGRLIGWGSLLRAIGVVGLWTVGTLGLGWLIFRQRELALYSGR